MRKETENFIQLCALCAVNSRNAERPPMGEMPLAQGPGQIVGIDLMGPLFTSSPSGYRYILTCIDHYSGWVEAYPLRTKHNEAILDRLANDYVPRHGCPNLLITDKGSEFRGSEFEQWLEGMGIQRNTTSGYNPQSNGKTERANGTIRRLLEKLVNGNRADWENRLGPALIALRNNVSSVTGFSPFVLHNARPARVAVGRYVDGSLDPSWSERLRLYAETIQKAVRATDDSRQSNRERLQRKANTKELTPGDQVLVRAQRVTPLTAKWDHGFSVVRVRGKVVTVLHHPSGKVSHHNRNKIKLVDPQITWEGIRARPRAQQVFLPPPILQKPETDGPEGAVNRPEPEKTSYSAAANGDTDGAPSTSTVRFEADASPPPKRGRHRSRGRRRRGQRGQAQKREREASPQQSPQQSSQQAPNCNYHIVTRSRAKRQCTTNEEDMQH